MKNEKVANRKSDAYQMSQEYALLKVWCIFLNDAEKVKTRKVTLLSANERTPPPSPLAYYKLPKTFDPHTLSGSPSPHSLDIRIFCPHFIRTSFIKDTTPSLFGNPVYSEGENTSRELVRLHCKNCENSRWPRILACRNIL